MADRAKAMLLGMEIVDNDLSLCSRVITPTLKIRRMTVAGH